jgi:chemotaxis protein methyltransferase CheR
MTSLGEVELTYVRDLVYRSSAIVIEAGKEYLVEARLTPVARDAGFGDLKAMVTHLRTSVVNGLHAKVVEAMTTNETTFFRDVHPFEMLKTEVLPRLIEAKRSLRTINIWCGAASTGQEPYTIAMVIRQMPELANWRVRIIATDMNEAVLARAREGLYSTLEINRGLPAHCLVKFFERDGASFRAKKEIKDLVEFTPLNLIQPWPAYLRGLDIVFMRNVLIYFDVPTKKRILGRVYDLLTADGLLFLGGAETTMNLDDRFQRIQSGRGVAYGRGR